MADPLLERPPLVTVLAATMDTLKAAGLDVELAPYLLMLAGVDAVEPLPLKLRWLRNRYTTAEEKPCIALAFVSDGPQDPSGQDQYPAAGEAVRELAVDIIVDLEVPTEVEAEEEELVADVAGLEILSHFERRALRALKRGFLDPADAATPLSAVAHWVQELGVDNDEDLVDFNGRLVSRINVLYRVRSDDPMILLAQGG
jgi:hypothetical protein